MIELLLSDPVVIVGGGMSGCLLALELLEATQRNVVIVEAGGIGHDDADTSHFLNGSSRFGNDEFGLLSAHGLGGGAMVNAMLATGRVPEELENFIHESDGYPVGEVGQMLLHHGGRHARLWWNGTRTHPSVRIFEYLNHPRLRVVQGEVSRLRFQNPGRMVSSVEGDFGTISARHVVMSSGALRTTALLLASGCADYTAGIGQCIQNHPCVFFDVDARSTSNSPFDVSVVREWTSSNGRLLLALAYERSLHAVDMGQLAVMVLDARSEGSMTMVNGRPEFTANGLLDDGDMEAMREAVRWASGVTGASIPGTDGELDMWMRAKLEFAAHASGGCFRAVDEHGSLCGHTGVWLADSSILARVPLATPSVAVTMEAWRIARHLSEVLS
jgi:choline dehydrogenase-like flavoprotein